MNLKSVNEKNYRKSLRDFSVKINKLSENFYIKSEGNAL